MQQAESSEAVVAPLQDPPPTIPYSWKRFSPLMKLYYIRDYEEANLRVSELQTGPYGFDLEWKPSFRKGEKEHRVALVQLANDTTALLLQISSMKSFPENLKAILEDPDCVKAGVGIQHDSKKIHLDYGVQMKNCVDLSLFARSVDSDWKGSYTNPLGLSRLVAKYENLVLGKGKITRSNWEMLLDENQKEYACNDAHSGFTIYSRLIAMAKLMDPVPKRTYYSYDVIRGLLCAPSGSLWNPHNPNYDPGPPPPPRAPKQKDQNGGESETSGPHRSSRPVMSLKIAQRNSGSKQCSTSSQRRVSHRNPNMDYRRTGRCPTRPQVQQHGDISVNTRLPDDI